MIAQNQPLLTIGITCYNDEKYLRVCLESVFNQTYPHLEIILVDDASTDGCPAILAEYGDRIIAIRHAQNSGGLTQGRIDVITSARGDYIAHLDADDYLEPDFAERLMQEAISDPELDWIAPNLNVVDGDGNLVGQWDYGDFPSDVREGLMRGFKIPSVPVPKNGVFKRSFLTKNNLTWYELPNTRQGEDALTCIRYLQCDPKIRLIPDFLMDYRVHGENMSAAPEERIKMIIGLKEYYIDNFNEFVYLYHPMMLKLPNGSDEYLAFKYLFLALDFLNARNNFEIPEVYRNERADEKIRIGLRLFDEPIRYYAEKSLSYSATYSGELNRILESLSPSGDPDPAYDPDAASPESVGIETTRSFDALASLGEQEFAGGNLELADRYTAAALQMNPDDTGCLNNSGVIAFNRGDYARSDAMLRKAMSLDPELEDTHLNLCSLWGKTICTTPPDSSRAPEILRSLRWLADNAPDDSRRQLMHENHALRDGLLDEYRNKFEGTNARVLLHRPGNGALKYLMDNWRDVLNYTGIPSETIDWGAACREQFERFRPTCFITVADPSYIDQLDSNYIAGYRRQNGLTIGHISTFEHRYEPCDFLITFHLDPEREAVMRRAELPLLSLPFGINPLEHYMKPGREVWDYFFVGSNSPFKREETQTFLQPLVGRYNGILAGTGWSVGLGELSVSDTSDFYQSSGIYPNFHVKRQMRDFNEVNDRTLIIPACGGFELTDNPVAMSELFAEDEMAAAASPREFQDMFARFLAHSEERRPYIQKGMRRVYGEYTLFHVLERLAAHLNIRSNSSAELSHA
ncbi:MAG: glycosyltransferase [bacterium]|nr:glycosyltransferase [bacterium]